MARPKRLVLPVLTNDDNGICTAQTPSGAGSMTLDGALVNAAGTAATATAAQLVTITSDGNDSGVTFTVTGTQYGQAVTDTITGPNATTATGTIYMDKVTDVTISAAGTGNIEVGWLAANGMISPAHVTDVYQTPFNASVEFDLTATTMTANVQYTLDDPFASYSNTFNQDAKWVSITGLSAVTADAVSNISWPVTAVRAIETTGSTTGAAVVTILQGN